MLVLCLSSGAFAVAPLIIPAWAFYSSLALHAGGAGLYYYMTQGGKSSVSSQGDISRGSNVAWVDMSGTVPMVTGDEIVAHLPLASAQALSANNPAKYPNIDSAVNKMAGSGAMSLTGTGSALAVGTLVNAGGKNYRIESGGGSLTVSSGFQILQAGIGYTFYAGMGDPSRNTYFGLDTAKHYFYKTPSGAVGYQSVSEINIPQVKVPKTLAESTTALVPLTVSPDDAQSLLLQAEFDLMFQDPSYIPTFTDSTTGLPYVPPPDSTVMSPDATERYNKEVNLDNANQTSLGSSNDRLNTAGAGVSGAGADVNTAQNNLTNNPTDPSLLKELSDAKRRLLDAEIELSKAKAADDKLKADLAKDELDKTDVAGVPAASAKYGDGTTQDFGGRFNTFISDMKQSSLFSMPGQLLGNVPSGGQSTFNVSFGRMGSTVFDLADYNVGLGIIKTLVLFTFSVSGFYIVTLKGGSG